MARAWRAGKSSPAMLSAAGRGSFIQSWPAPPGSTVPPSPARWPPAPRPWPAGMAASPVPPLLVQPPPAGPRRRSYHHSRSSRLLPGLPRASNRHPSRCHRPDRLQPPIPGPRRQPAHWCHPGPGSSGRRGPMALHRHGPRDHRHRPTGRHRRPTALDHRRPTASAPAPAHGTKDHHDQHGEDHEPQGATATVKDEGTSFSRSSWL